MEVIDSIGDFFRFIEFSTRRMASNQKRSFSEMETTIQEQPHAGIDGKPSADWLLLRLRG